ncbi:hypothetical protein [Halobellus captivus]|nr:hypothetical protein [Halobellus captivus]
MRSGPDSSARGVDMQPTDSGGSGFFLESSEGGESPERGVSSF